MKMKTRRAAKAKGSDFEMNCQESLKQIYPDVYLTKQRGFQSYICTCCKILKSLSEFYKSKSAKKGFDSRCKVCTLERGKKFRNLNPHYRGEYYLIHREKEIKQTIKYHKRNKEIYNKYSREWIKKKRKKSLQYKILCCYRTRFHTVINNKYKSKKSIEYLGCDFETLKIHLESKFKKEMNWDNYGSYWEIDHILPCSYFDFSDQEDIVKCFHYTNLQPLSISENRKKGDKLDYKTVC